MSSRTKMRKIIRKRELIVSDKNVMELLEKLVKGMATMQEDIHILKEWKSETDKKCEERRLKIFSILRNYIAPSAVGITLLVVGYFLGTGAL